MKKLLEQDGDTPISNESATGEQDAELFSSPCSFVWEENAEPGSEPEKSAADGDKERGNKDDCATG